MHSAVLKKKYCSQRFPNEVALLLSENGRIIVLLQGTGGLKGGILQPYCTDWKHRFKGTSRIACLFSVAAAAVSVQCGMEVLVGSLLWKRCLLLLQYRGDNMPLKWKTSSPAIWKFPVPVLKTSRSTPLSPAYM